MVDYQVPIFGDYDTFLASVEDMGFNPITELNHLLPTIIPKAEAFTINDLSLEKLKQVQNAGFFGIYSR